MGLYERYIINSIMMPAATAVKVATAPYIHTFRLYLSKAEAVISLSVPPMLYSDG